MIANTYFHHTSIRVADFEKAVRFYLNLGLEKYVEWEESQGRCCFLKISDNNFLELKEYKEKIYNPGRLQHICFHCDDVDALYELALKNGAKTRRPPTEIPLKCKPAPVERARVCHIIGPSEEEIEIINWYGFQL